MQISKQLKFIFFIAFAVLVLLVVVLGFQLIQINKNKRTIEQQQTEITRLQNQIDYYESLQET